MITVIAVGNKQPSWVNAAFHDYALRLPSDWRLTLKEVKAEPRVSGKTVSSMKQLEAMRIREALPKHDYCLITLDEHGKRYTTEAFSKLLEKLRSRHGHLSFVIGGPDGLDDQLKLDSAHELRISDMTLPHGLARILLAEQIYRAWSLLNNHPYHRS